MHSQKKLTLVFEFCDQVSRWLIPMFTIPWKAAKPLHHYEAAVDFALINTWG